MGEQYEVPPGYLEIKLGWRLLFMYHPLRDLCRYQRLGEVVEFPLGEYVRERADQADDRGYVEVRAGASLIFKYRPDDGMVWYKNGKFNREFSLPAYVRGQRRRRHGTGAT